MRFLTVSEFRKMAELGANTEDTLIDKLLVGVSHAMEKKMDRWMVKQSYTEVIKPENNVVWLRAYPIDLAQSFIVTDNAMLVPTIDYYTDARIGKVTRLFSNWYQAGHPTLSITYTGGYPQVGEKEEQYVQVPEELQWACALQAQYYYNNRKDLGSNNMSVAGTSISIAPVKWLPQVLEILESHTRIVI